MYIGDVFCFIELLSYYYGFFYVEVQMGVGCLLQGGGDEWCVWFVVGWFIFMFQYVVVGFFQQ